MMANLIRKYSKLKLYSEEALEQYKLLDAASKKMAELTGMGWDVCTTDAYILEMHATLIEGILIGAGAVGLIAYLAYKNKKKKDS